VKSIPSPKFLDHLVVVVVLLLVVGVILFKKALSFQIKLGQN